MSACQRLQINAARALALAALIHRRHRRIQRLQPRHNPFAVPVRRANQRPARPHAVIRQPDPSRKLRQQRHVLILLVDRFQIVLRRIQQIARRHLRMLRARIKQRRRTRQIIVRRDQLDKTPPPPARCATTRSSRAERIAAASPSPRASPDASTDTGHKPSAIQNTQKAPTAGRRSHCSACARSPKRTAPVPSIPARAAFPSPTDCENE